jgi:hypothetical protein
MNEPQRSSATAKPYLYLASELVALGDIYEMQDRLTATPTTIISSHQSAVDHCSLSPQQFTLLLKRESLFNSIYYRGDISLSWPKLGINVLRPLREAATARTPGAKVGKERVSQKVLNT